MNNQNEGTDPKKTVFDFDELAELATADPKAFEKRREAEVDAYILKQPEDYHHRLRQLQWKIDAVRSVSPNSLASCIRIYDLMMERVYGEGGLLDNLKAIVDKNSTQPAWPPEKEGARIITLRPQE